jgi:hypothetical protein
MFAGISVEAIVDRTEMLEGDTFTLTIEVASSETKGVNEPRLPNMAEFDLLQTWRSSETSSVYTNGKFQVNIKQKFNYTLSPKKKGKLTLPAFSVVVDSKAYNTKPIRLKVIASNDKSGQNRVAKKAQKKQPSPFGFDPFDNEEDIFSQLLKQRSRLNKGFRTEPVNPEHAFFIQLEVDKTSAYIGEQVTASWYLYTKNHISEIDTIKHPSLKGFWKEDIEMVTRLNFTNETINGVRYKKALLQSAALFPINAGKPLIDTYKAKCTVLIGNKFGFGKSYSFTKASEEMKIQVLALPTLNQPQNYSGAVGLFRLSAKVEKPNVPVNQPISLKIRFEGRGNAKLIDLPKLDLPANLEFYDSQKESKFNKNGTSYTVFEVLLIPRSEGEVKIPSISVGLFDPVKKSYYSESTQEIVLNVTPEVDSGKLESSPLAGDAENKSVNPKEPDLVLTWNEPWFQIPTKIKALTWGGAYSILILFFIWRMKVEFGWGQQSQDLLDKTQKRLSLVRELLKKDQWREVGVEVTNTIYFVMGEITHVGGSDETFEKMLKKSPPSFRMGVGEELKTSLKHFETLGFAPDEVVGGMKDEKEIKKEFAKAEKIIVKAVKTGMHKVES